MCVCNKLLVICKTCRLAAYSERSKYIYIWEMLLCTNKLKGFHFAPLEGSYLHTASSIISLNGEMQKISLQQSNEFSRRAFESAALNRQGGYLSRTVTATADEWGTVQVKHTSAAAETINTSPRCHQDCFDRPLVIQPLLESSL